MSAEQVTEITWKLTGLGLAYLFQTEIKDTLKYVYTTIQNNITCKIIIHIKHNPKCAFTIKQGLIGTDNNWVSARDGQNKMHFGVTPGNYLAWWENRPLFIVVDKETITLTVPKWSFNELYQLTTNTLNYIGDSINSRLCCEQPLCHGQPLCHEQPVCQLSTIDRLKNFLNEIYERCCSSEDVICYYTVSDNNWSCPEMRKPRDISKLTFNTEANNFLADVDQFMTSEQDYKTKGQPYRRGYLLHGITGGGKSTMIEVVSVKYNYSVYLLQLNSYKMTDGQLVNLVNSIPENSIIVLEELDRQLQTLEKNARNMVSIGGILTALDGPQRLSSGTIVIITTNDMDYVKNKFEGALLRSGRIDKNFSFNTAFNN